MTRSRRLVEVPIPRFRGTLAPRALTRGEPRRSNNPNENATRTSGGGRRPDLVVRLVLIAAITIGSLVVLLHNVDLRHIIELLGGVHLGWATAGLFAFVFGHFVRCWRYRLIWRWRVDSGALGTTAVHGFATYMLPMRLGELALPLLVRRGGYATFRTAFGGLVVVRIFDAILVLMLGAMLVYADPAALSFLWSDGSHVSMSRLASGGLFLALVAAASVVTYFVPGVASAQGRLAFAGLSVVIWASILGMNYAVLNALGVAGEPVVLVLLVVLGLLVTIVPLQGFASLGGHELVWMLSLVAGGASSDAAIQMAVTSHVVMVGYVCMLGLMGLGLILHGSRDQTNS